MIITFFAFLVVLFYIGQRIHLDRRPRKNNGPSNKALRHFADTLHARLLVGDWNGAYQLTATFLIDFNFSHDALTSSLRYLDTRGEFAKRDALKSYFDAFAAITQHEDLAQCSISEVAHKIAHHCSNANNMQNAKAPSGVITVVGAY